MYPGRPIPVRMSGPALCPFSGMSGSPSPALSPSGRQKDTSLEALSFYPVGRNDFDCDEAAVHLLFGHAGTAANIAADTNKLLILPKKIASRKCIGICSPSLPVKYGVIHWAKIWRLLAPLRLPGQIFMATPYALRFVVWIVPGF